MVLSILHRYMPEEAYLLGLYDPRRPESDFSRFASRSSLTRIQRSLNPEPWAPILNDKGLFYRFCMECGISVPRLLGLLFRDCAGWAEGGEVLATPEDWAHFFERSCPEDFVVKPSRSEYGTGIRFIRRRGGKLTGPEGMCFTGLSLYESLLSDRRFDSFVVQSRVENHQALTEMSGERGLQTVRIVTVVRENGKTDIICAFLKPIVGSNLVDNHKHGELGNLMAEVLLETGELKKACKMTLNGGGFQDVPIHPRTGVRFEGFQLPLWEETCALARDAALKFLPVRTIGWDIAVTPSGPIVIEGNIWYDPPTFHRRTDEFVLALKAG
jgi:hypothetical protein